MGLTEIDAVSVKLSIINFPTDVQLKKEKKIQDRVKKEKKKNNAGKKNKKRERERNPYKFPIFFSNINKGK